MTKFGLFFEEESVPEWRPKYMNYAKVKRAVRDLEDQLLNPKSSTVTLPPVLQTVPTGGLVPVPEELSFESAPAPARPPPAPYASVIALLDRQLEKVEGFYNEREKEAVDRWNAVVSQLRLIEELESRLRANKLEPAEKDDYGENTMRAVGMAVNANANSNGNNFFRFPGFGDNYGNFGVPLSTLSRNQQQLPNEAFAVPANFMARGATYELPQTPRPFKKPEWERLFTGMGSFVAKSPVVKPDNATKGTTAGASSGQIAGTSGLSLPQSDGGTPNPTIPTTPLILGPAASPSKPPSVEEISSMPLQGPLQQQPMAPSSFLRHRTVTSTHMLPSAAGLPPAPPIPSPLQPSSTSRLTPAFPSVESLAGLSPAPSTGIGSFSSPPTPRVIVAPIGNIRSLADARRNLKKVVMEYYRYLTLVRNFQSLNRGAFERAVRRMDEILQVSATAASERRKSDRPPKISDRSPSVRSMETIDSEVLDPNSDASGIGKKWFRNRVLQATFCASTTVPRLVAGTEDLYVKLCTTQPYPFPAEEHVVPPSERRKLIHQLRVPEHSLNAAPQRGGAVFGPTYRSGFLFGLMLPPFIASIYSVITIAATDSVFPDYIRMMLQIHAGFFIPLLLLFLFAVNTLAYSRVQINYPFIFEFDPRDYLTPYQLMELSLIATTLITYSLYLSVGNNFLPFIPATLYPAILAIILGILCFWPFNQLHRTARWWFIRTMARIMVFNIGVGRVEFRDFFITDELNSLTYTFTSMQAFVCAYVSRWNDLGVTCPTGATYFIALPTSFPALWRLSQCLLRWRETGNAWPHGANALKYVMSLLVIWFSTWSRISGLLEARILWIVFAALSASYSYFWDVYYDWGLWRNLNIHGKHFLLRDELRYAPAAIYYVAMVLNAFLRINWIFLISPSYWGILIDGRILAILFAILEVYRRFQWNLFRMENEHLNNCGMYRAVLDIPLPFQIFEPPSDEKQAVREERKRIRADRVARVKREATMNGGLDRGLSMRREGTGVSVTSKKVTSTPEMEMGLRPMGSSTAVSAMGGIPEHPASGSLKPRDTGLGSLEYTPRFIPEGLAMLAEDEGLKIDEELERVDDDDDDEADDPADDEDSD